MSAKQSTQWFWSDWAGDVAVRSLTPAERGLWMDLLTLAATGNPTGYVVDARGEPLPLEQIARFANCTLAECSSLIDGILKKGVASRDRSGRLLNRRMVRDLELSVKRKRAGSIGAASTKLKWQAISGLPQQLPGHVPRQTGTRALPSRNTTSTFSVSARDGALQQSGSATEPGRATIATSEDLKTSMQRKGWIPS